MNDFENGQKVLTLPLEENPVIAELLRLLTQEKAEQLTDFKELVQCVGAMETQLTQTTAELQTIKQELQSLRGRFSGVEKTLFSGLTSSLDMALRQARDQLGSIKSGIVRAAEIVAGDMKGKGISGLNRTLEAIGVHKALSALQTHLNKTSKVLETGMERVEAIGRELREAGGHMQNAGNVISGKERQAAPAGQGRMTAAILAPLRRIHDAIGKMESLSGRALSSLNRLERAAKEERPSVKDTLKSLKSQRAQANKTLKRQEHAR